MSKEEAIQAMKEGKMDMNCIPPHNKSERN